MSGFLRTDTRGVSEVVGAVLLLGILVLLLSLQQAVIVPNQNAQTEFQHNQQIESEFVDVRNAIIEARSAGRSTLASLQLGTQYQNRLFTVNPPQPSGTVETTRQANVSVTGASDADPLDLATRPLENNFVEYTPRYYEYRSAGTVRYENTVAYHDYGEQNVLLSGQSLLRGNTVSLIPVEGTFRESGTRRIAIEPMPGVLETVPVDDPVITVPTELSESDWERLLEDELDGDDEVSVSDGTLTLELDGTYDVAYAPVGVNRVPREGQRGESGSEINPAAPGDVQLVGADWSGSTVELTFRNSAEDSAFTSGRINFYAGSGNTPTRVDSVNVGANDPRGTNCLIGDDFNNLDPNIVLEGEESTTSVDFVFDRSVNEQQDFFIVTLTLESGQQATYFIGGSFSFDANGNGNGANGDEPSSLDITNVDSEGARSLNFDVENDGENTVDLIGVEVDNPDRSTFNQLQITGPSPQVLEDGPLSADGDRIDHDSFQLPDGQSASYRAVDFDGTGNIDGETIRLRIYYELDGTELFYEETVTV